MVAGAALVACDDGGHGAVVGAGRPRVRRAVRRGAARVPDAAAVRAPLQRQLVRGGGGVRVHARHGHVAVGHAPVQERVHEDAAELLSERAVEDEVDGAVEADEEVAEVRQHLVAVGDLDVGVVDGVRQVVHQRRHLQPSHAQLRMPHAASRTFLNVTRHQI